LTFCHCNINTDTVTIEPFWPHNSTKRVM